MQTLGAWAAQQELQPPALLALMGEPDERRDCAAGSCEPLLRSLVWPDDRARATGLGATELWIYNWRRGRDRLVLALRGQQVTAAGWRYLGE